jgi:hypothetical protein
MPAVASAAWDSQGQEDCSNVVMHPDDERHGGASAPETDADTSAGEYLATDDRTKAYGYNRLPHRPGPPDIRRQMGEARRGERRAGDDPA